MKDKALLWAGVRRFEDILRKDPDAYSFAPLSDLYRELGLLEDALKVARKGCELHPEFAAGQMALARAAFESALKDEARRALEAVTRITPENLEAQRLLADIYSADGNEAAALCCLETANSLDVFQPLPVPAEDIGEEEILDADILELTDDQIEEESSEEPAISPFSAEPERPSLGDAVRAEPYLMESPPPLYDEDEPAAPATVASATIAELYVNQGFPEKGAEIYRELLETEPDNQVYVRRIEELLRPVTEKMDQNQLNTSENTVAEESAGSQGIMDALNDWLLNIRGVRECRTKIL